MEHLGKTRIEQGGFLLFLALVSLAALVVVLPFLNPLLWATLAAIMFQPLFRWFQAKRPGKDTQAALLTLLVIFIAVIIPAIMAPVTPQVRVSCPVSHRPGIRVRGPSQSCLRRSGA